MAGLLRRAVGAGLTGLGAGIVQEAKSTREKELLRLRRRWQVEDRDLGHRRAVDLASQTQSRADRRQRASDARAAAARAEDREHRSGERELDRELQRELAGARGGRAPRLTLMSEDLTTGARQYGIFDPQIGKLVPVGVVGQDNEVIEDMTGDDDGPGWFERIWQALVSGRGGDTDEPEPEPELEDPVTGARYRRDPTTGEIVPVE